MNRKEVSLIILALVIFVFLIIIGITTITSSFETKTLMESLIVTSIFFTNAKEGFFLLGLIYNVMNPHLPIYIAGMIMIILGIVGTFVLTITKGPDLYSNLDDHQKNIITIIFIIICIILAITGINMLLNSVQNRRESSSLIMALIIINEGSKEMVFLGAVYDGLKPHYSTFIIGIVMTGFGIAATCISTIRKSPDFHSKFEDRQILGFIIIIIIICIISLIIGIATILGFQQKTKKLTILLITSIYINLESLVEILIIIGMGFQSYSPEFISGILMTVIGVLGSVVSIIIYKYPAIQALSTSYAYPATDYRKYRPGPIIRRRPQKKLTLSKCPACHAPLRKKPPCECEYCGSIVK